MAAEIVALKSTSRMYTINYAYGNILDSMIHILRDYLHGKTYSHTHSLKSRPQKRQYLNIAVGKVSLSNTLSLYLQG